MAIVIKVFAFEHLTREQWSYFANNNCIRQTGLSTVEHDDQSKYVQIQRFDLCQYTYFIFVILMVPYLKRKKRLFSQKRVQVSN